MTGRDFVGSASLATRALGRTSLSLTVLGLGSAPLGGLYRPVDDDEAVKTVAHAYARGIRYFDTAPLYGFGLAERRVGAALRRQRNDFVISTKVGRLLRPVEDAAPDPLFPGAPPLRPVFDFSYDGVMRSFHESLERLGLDSVDILLIHDPDHHQLEALSGAAKALGAMKAAGVVKAIGVGMNHAGMLQRMASEADFDCFLLAGRYTLLEQTSAEDLLHECQTRRIGVLIGGVFNSGVLASTGPEATFDYAPVSRAILDRVRGIQAICSRWNVPLKAAALQFPLAHPAVTSVVTGPRSVAELDELCDALTTPVPKEMWEELRHASYIADYCPIPS
ncbi:aldo/keto reductase [bacterium]|nr:MAG: aldo/keto reductase [bacterium]